MSTSTPTIPDLRHRAVTQYNNAADLYNSLVDCIYEGIASHPGHKDRAVEDTTNNTIDYIKSFVDQINLLKPDIVHMSDHLDTLLSKANECSEKLKLIGM